MAPEEQLSAPKDAPAIPKGYTIVAETNWWMISGVMVALGALLIGLGVVVIGLEAQASYNNFANYETATYILIGIGIVFLGMSWLCARMTPRIK